MKCIQTSGPDIYYRHYANNSAPDPADYSKVFFLLLQSVGIFRSKKFFRIGFKTLKLLKSVYFTWYIIRHRTLIGIRHRSLIASCQHPDKLFHALRTLQFVETHRFFDSTSHRILRTGRERLERITGNPIIGIKRGWELGRIGEVMDDALPTAAVVILVTGGGGVFGKVLTETGVGTALANTLVSLGIPILPAAFIIAAALRASQGSATVAILTTAGLLADAAAAYSDNYRVMITIAIGFGGFGFSHINDSFFWILTKYLNMSVSEGLRTWTLITSVIGIVGFFFTWLVTMLFF